MDVQTSPTHDVTLTINGQRRTFYFTPASSGFFFLNYYLPRYTAEPGFFGSLTATGDNCGGVMLSIGGQYECGISNPGQAYQASGYTYTDPYGRVYTIGPDGALQSLKDLNGNTLTVSPSGVTSSLGPSIAFTRDATGRITKITGPANEQLTYVYSAAGDLTSVTDPTGQTVSFTYDANHNLLVTKDPLNRPFRTLHYTDGRLTGIEDALGNVTTVSSDVGDRQEVVTDAAGRLTTITTFDARGNKVRRDEVSDGHTRTTPTNRSTWRTSPSAAARRSTVSAACTAP